MIKIELDIQKIQTVVTALQKSDPMGMYTVDLVKEIVDQANAQITPPEAETSKPKK